jgi:serine/threonine protein kinase
MESLINETLNKHDFEMTKIIGNGSYGKVYLTTEKKTKKPYAIKIQQKNLLILQNQVEHSLYEFNILKYISRKDINMKNKSFALIHNFFQDSKFIYFVLDYIPGGELFTLMRKEIKFSPSNAKFYIAQIIDALDSLHRNKIIYRDLKPENLLIDVDGYLKIVDFGVAKQIENRTNTLAGTPTYMAPEIVNKENYSFEVDWWSLGILTYEMTVGLDPWDENDTFKIYEKIKKGMILFPKNMDKKLKNFIQHLLIGDPKKRMGSFINDKTTDKENENDNSNIKNNITNNKKEIKKINIYEHIFLKNFHWKELRNKELEPFYIPKIKRKDDASNFNEYQDEDDEIEIEDILENEDPFLSWNF